MAHYDQRPKSARFQLTEVAAVSRWFVDLMFRRLQRRERASALKQVADAKH